jgi:hypothetical protein
MDTVDSQILDGGPPQRLIDPLILEKAVLYVNVRWVVLLGTPDWANNGMSHSASTIHTTSHLQTIGCITECASMTETMLIEILTKL